MKGRIWKLDQICANKLNSFEAIAPQLFSHQIEWALNNAKSESISSFWLYEIKQASKRKKKTNKQNINAFSYLYIHKML